MLTGQGTFLDDREQPEWREQGTGPAEHDSVLARWERQPRASMRNSPDFLQADVPSVGTFTARAIATVYAAILDGRLIAANQLAELSAVAFEGTDQVFGNPLGWPWANRSVAPAPQRTRHRPRSAAPAEGAAMPTRTPPRDQVHGLG